MMIHWKCIPFSELNVKELYDILSLRQDIFIIEQACIYQDIDGIDHDSHHVLAMSEDRLIAYARIIPQKDHDIVKLGRILVLSDHRGISLGKDLVHYAIQEASALFSPRQLHISAQSYLKQFYESLGFRPISTIYDLDGISHLDMALDI
jgi:ElaA protein